MIAESEVARAAMVEPMKPVRSLLITSYVCSSDNWLPAREIDAGCGGERFSGIRLTGTFTFYSRLLTVCYLLLPTEQCLDGF